MFEIPILYPRCYEYVLSLELNQGYHLIYTYEYKSKFYVGQTRYLNRRHWNHSQPSKCRRQIINGILAKHKDIKPIVRWMGKKEYIDDAERHFIGYYDSKYPNGYNQESGGCVFKNLGESTKNKIAESKKKPIL